MPNEDFTVMLDKREGHNVKGAELGGDVLKGKPIYRTGNTGLAESIKEVLHLGWSPIKKKNQGQEVIIKNYENRDYILL